jgi:hypothetical protein
MYIKFIEEFDSCGIGFALFFGSSRSKIISVKKQIEEHKEIFKNDYFPFGKDADGSVFLFNRNGEVLWWDKYDYSFEQKPKFLASSFEEFIDECLLGKRLGEFVTPEKNALYKTLQAQGWI